jgi:hypothetical protein
MENGNILFRSMSKLGIKDKHKYYIALLVKARQNYYYNE